MDDPLETGPLEEATVEPADPGMLHSSRAIAGMYSFHQSASPGVFRFFILLTLNFAFIKTVTAKSNVLWLWIGIRITAESLWSWIGIS